MHEQIIETVYVDNLYVDKVYGDKAKNTTAITQRQEIFIKANEYLQRYFNVKYNMQEGSRIEPK